eukprot:SAG31_NODE_7098_length_1789_cov_1.710651_2_plen_122_part_00
MQVLQGHKAEVLRLCWGACGNLLASAGAEGKVILWRRSQNRMDGLWTETGCIDFVAADDGAVNPIAAQGHERQVYGCEFVAQAQRLLAAADDLLHEYDVASGKLIRQWKFDSIGNEPRSCC